MALVSPSGRDFTVVARALLKTAEKLGLDPAVVRTDSDGLYGMGFRVPDELADRFVEFLEDAQDPINVSVLALPKAGGDEEPVTIRVEEPVADAEPEKKTPAKKGPGRPKKAQE
jgi:hypothetical protein